MRIVIVGLGNQGRKRRQVAAGDVVATVDPFCSSAHFADIVQVPLDSYDAALVCVPDTAKLNVLRFLLAHGKHVLVEKPLLADRTDELLQLEELARSNYAVCYTAYNHRFEPNILRLREILASQSLGRIYSARMYYGNGTARDVRNSAWRDQGLGVLTDLGSHLLDLVPFLFGVTRGDFVLWNDHRHENRAIDHCQFGAVGEPTLSFEVSLLSWRNTFTIDVVGEGGSAHLDGLCKWGPSQLTIRERVLPSGRPTEKVDVVAQPDPTWQAEYSHFKQLCTSPVTTIGKDIWINSVLAGLAHSTQARVAA